MIPINEHDHIKNISSHFYFHLRILSMLNVVYQPLHSLGKSAFIMIFYGCYWIDRPVPFEIIYGQFLSKVLQIHGCHVSFIGKHKHNSLRHVRVAHYSI